MQIKPVMTGRKMFGHTKKLPSLFGFAPVAKNFWAYFIFY